MQAMERLMENRTTFMIAHRMSTLADCDMRLEVTDGRVKQLDQVKTERISRLHGYDSDRISEESKYVQNS
jgi:ABC-type transport system involved in cytochrome bd biosynthesis fused ATPase/permease subunit